MRASPSCPVLALTAALTVIALDLGFATPQHFSRSFSELVGETPTAYRQRTRR